MPAHKLSQKSFVNGQYDRTAQNQESVSGAGIVASGLSYAKNVLSSDRGELRKRLGTKKLIDLNAASVVIPYRQADDSDAILVVTPGENIIGYEFSSGEPQRLQTVVGGAAITFPSKATWEGISSSGTTATSGNWTVRTSIPPYTDQTYDSYYCPSPQYVSKNLLGTSGFYLIYRATAPGQYIQFENPTEPGVLKELKVTFYTEDRTTYKLDYWNNVAISYSDDGSTWTGLNTQMIIGNTTTSKRVVHYPGPAYIGGDVTWYRSQVTNIIKQTEHSTKHKYWRITFYGNTVPATSALSVSDVDWFNPATVADFSTSNPYSGDDIKNIKYAQDKSKLFITCAGKQPILIDTNAGQITATNFTPSNTPTFWTITGGYPAAVALSQNRLWFGGFENKKTTVYASNFGDYNTFSENSPLQYTDMLNLTCNQLKSGITNIVGGQNVIYCFSQDGISMIDGGSSGIIATNQALEFQLKNRMPAGNATPAFKDDIMLYSSSDGTKLYGVDFDLLVNRFQVEDLAKYAKDITYDKVTELHYINNESKLVYGLTEAKKMFALLFDKSRYQGFFPLDFNAEIYDICPLKVGRDYKLIMVSFREGHWYIEEKLDCGHYIDTSIPRLTSDEKKWATYDNLENNIALDCYQTYDEHINVQCFVNGNGLISEFDFTPYIDKTIMFGLSDSKDWSIYTINSVNKMSCWTMNNDGTGQKFYTLSSNPNIGDDLLDENGNVLSDYSITSQPYESYGFTVMSIAGQPSGGITPVYTVYKYSSFDKYLTDVTLETQRGNLTSFTIAYPEFTTFNSSGNITPSGSPLISYYELIDSTHLLSRLSLTSYLERTVLLNNTDSDDFVVLTLDSDGTPDPETINLSHNSWSGITSTDNKIVVFGNFDSYISSSEDGVNWAVPAVRVAAVDGAYGNGKFVALNYDGYISTSIDGISWTEPQNVLGNDGWESIVYDGNQFFAFGNTLMSTSVDGITWTTPVTRPASSSGFIAYGDGKFVALGGLGELSTSTDGFTWTTPVQNRTLFPSAWDYLYYNHTYRDISYGGGKFVAVNKEGFMSTSVDGVTWTALTQKSELMNVRKVAYFRNKYYFTKGNIIVEDSGIGYTYNITQVSKRGGTTIFSNLYVSPATTPSVFSPDASLGVISEGRYFDDLHTDVFGNITLPAPCHKVTFGAIYESLAILKIQQPYESLKCIAQVDVSVINTTHLEIGTDFADTESIEKIDDSSYYDLTRITMNDTYRQVISDTPEMTKNLILRSNKGVPFTVNAVDVYVNYSNLGGD